MARTEAQEKAYLKIAELVRYFEENIDTFKKTQNETETRIQLINPLFDALGWDIDNSKTQAPPHLIEVLHEDKVMVEGHKKAPDYSFRIDGKRKFFLEAKKPKVYIWDNMESAFQLRRYGWSGGAPISILTDFEEFAVYDCTRQPFHTEKAHVARIKYLTFNEYLENFDWLWEIFSKEAVENGSLEKYAKADKKGSQTVDVAFLASLDAWRNRLAVNIALNNKTLTEEEINFLVQININRIVFLRNCEDRYVEPYGNLKQSITHTAEEGIYFKRLVQLFKEGDNRYNSGLFDFQRDTLSEKIKVDNLVIYSIVNDLYYPNSPYEFSVIGAEILGTAYERFLGKVIKLNKKHEATIEEKPEVRKAGGVFYTPQYIVEYIVKQTVGKLVEGKTPDEIAKIKICDPACGSGSFLLGAYQYLLNYHLEWYVKNSAKLPKGKNAPLIFTGKDKQNVTLSLKVKKAILLNNIFGVDLDSQAVEVSKLSLLMKCLEGESEVSLQPTLATERVLPNIDNNIQSGNSLIDFDFYGIKSKVTYNNAIKPFNWQQAFPQVFKQGGFDVVIGNPPYVYLPNKSTQQYFTTKYKHQDYQQDLYLLFLERYADLLALKGVFGVIISNTWLQSVLLKKIRKYLVQNYQWEYFLHLPNKVFADAVVDTHAIVFKKGQPSPSHKVNIEIYQNAKISLLNELIQTELPQNGEAINLIASLVERDLFEKIKNNSIHIKEVATVYNGVKPFEKGKGTPAQTAKTMKDKPFVKENCPQPDKNWSPLLRGSLIHRYKSFWNHDSWILYGKWLAAPRDKAIFDAPEKIMVRQTGDSIIATKVGKGFIARNNLHIIIANKDIKHSFLLGILNSTVGNFYYTQMNPEKGEALAEVKKHHVEMLPYPKKYEKAAHDEIVKQVDLLLQLNIDLAQESKANAQAQIKGRIAFAEQRINALVYELYGLTEEEIKVVEGR